MAPAMGENHHAQAQGFWLQQVSPKREPLGPRSVSRVEGGPSPCLPRMPSETLTTLVMAAGDAVVVAVPFGEHW